MGRTRRTEFSGSCYKWQGDNLEVEGVWENDLKISGGNKNIEVVSRAESRRSELKRSAVVILILSQWINSEWFTLHVGPYVLIQIIRNWSGYVKCRLDTQHNLQGTSQILPWWGEISCSSCAWQPNAKDWSEVAKGLSSTAACCTGVSPGEELLSSVCALSDRARELLSPSCYSTGGNAPQPPDGLRARDGSPSLLNKINYKP